MPKTLFCNSFEVGHNKEVFCLVFKFQGPDGSIVETAYVTISPPGTKTLIEQLVVEMKDHEKEHGAVEPWKMSGNTDPKTGPSSNANKYRV